MAEIGEVRETDREESEEIGPLLQQPPYPPLSPVSTGAYFDGAYRHLLVFGNQVLQLLQTLYSYWRCLCWCIASRRPLVSKSTWITVFLDCYTLAPEAVAPTVVIPNPTMY